MRGIVSRASVAQTAMPELSQSASKTEARSEGTPPSPSFGLAPLVWLALLLLAVIFFGAIRYRLRGMPLERDEGEYAYAGQLLLQGIPPYSLAYNMKLPGIYAAYAGILWLFGQSSTAIHLGLLLINAATTIVLFFLARLLFGDMAAFVAGCSYAVLSTSSSVMGFEAHATNFVVLPALTGIFLLLHALRSRQSWLLFLSGLPFGIAVLMKQHGVFFVLFGLYLLCSETRRGDHWRFWREVAIFIAGVIAPYVTICAWLYRAGVFGEFWFWTVAYAGEYSKVGLRRAVRAFLENSATVVAPSVLVWTIAALGISALFWSLQTRQQSRFLWALLLFSFLSLCPGAYFRVHYYILILPVCSLLAGVAVSAAAEKLAAGGRRAWQIAPLGIFALCLAASVWRQRLEYFSLAPVDVFRATYGDNAFLPALKIADYIRENSAEQARIAVLGSEPEIYFYAHRHSATSYIYMYSLIVRHKYTARMREEMVRQLETNRPEYVVDVDVVDSWGERNVPQAAAFLAQLQDFLTRQYEVVGVVEIAASDRYLWGAEAQNYLPPGKLGAIYLYKRKGGSFAKE
jgi:hypothetical protein